MLPDRRMPEDEVCPVRDELLGELYCAAEHGVSDLVASVAPDIRALLALYCYRRSHLHTRGVAIAASCDQDDLVRWGGHVGAFCSRGWPLVVARVAQARLVVVGFGTYRNALGRFVDALGRRDLETLQEIAARGRELEGGPPWRAETSARLP